MVGTQNIPLYHLQEQMWVIYAFYKNIVIDGSNPIVLVWHDANRTEILAKNFEDFIFRKMIERIV